MSTPAAINWIKQAERVVAQDHATLADVANRPLKFIMTQSDFGLNDSFPGFMARWTGTSSPEGIITSPVGHAFVNTSALKLYIKMTPSGNTGWAEIQSVPAGTQTSFSNNVFIGASAANSEMSLGLTIDQGAADDDILAFKSSDIAHGMTTRAETNSYAKFKKSSGTAGGLFLMALSEAALALDVVGYATTPDVTKGAVTSAVFRFTAGKKSAATTIACDGEDNVFLVQTAAAGGGEALFLIDATGDAYIQSRLFVGLGPTSGLVSSNNAFQTVGLTINQSTSDDDILAFKSSDVAHGMTTLTETDTYGTFSKTGAADGGLQLVGYTEQQIALVLAGRYTVGDTTKTVGSIGGILIKSDKKSGTTVAALSANENIVVFRAFDQTRFILDADGDSHQDVGTAWTNFDTHDDLGLLNKLSAHVTRIDDPLRESFGNWLNSAQEELEALKLVTFNSDGHHFVNMSRLQMLTVGAIRQLGEKIDRMEKLLLPA